MGRIYANDEVVSDDNPLPVKMIGGSSTPGDDSITTSMIQDGAVTAEKLAPDAVTAANISDASTLGRSVLTAADLATVIAKVNEIINHW